MAVELTIKLYRESETTENEDDSGLFCAQLTNDDSIIAGHGEDPYEALHDLVNELQFQHEYFRPD